MVNSNDLNNSTNFYISAGAEYINEEYVWVGQQMVTSNIVPAVRTAYLFFT